MYSDIFNRFTALLYVLFAVSLMASVSVYAGQNSNTYGAMSGATPTHIDEPAALTLRDAIALVLQNNPELAAFDRETQGLAGARLQAGLLPNPVAGLEVEDIGGSGQVQRFSTLRISQLFELGGKRAARVDAATASQALALQDYEVKRLDLMSQTANAYTDVLATQQRVRLADESLQLAQSAFNTVTKRVKAGKAAPIEQSKSTVALASVGIEREQAARELSASKKKLAMLWGNPEPIFTSLLGDLQSRVAVPPLDELTQQLPNNPNVLRGDKSLEQRRAQLALEQSLRTPDVTISAGVRRFDRIDETTAVFGISVPIPLFNQNQGSIQQAQQQVEKAEFVRSNVELQLKSALVQTYESLLSVQNEVDVLQNEILPAAQSAFDAAKRGYELGKFDFLELLDAQRTLFQNRVLYWQALANYQRQVNQLERLIAAPLQINQTQTNNERSPS